jgi:quercetin dioxygenase-like cupin family protein
VLRCEPVRWSVLLSILRLSRRSFLTLTGALGLGRGSQELAAKTLTPPDYVLGPAGGEHLVHFRDRGDVVIKSGAATGSPDLAIGTQQVKVGTGIPIHRHLKMEERFYVLEGSGRVILADAPHAFEQGATIIIPKNTWHGFENPDHELLLLWIVTPAGLDGFFRETCTPPGATPKALSREQIKEIARKYDTEFR